MVKSLKINKIKPVVITNDQKRKQLYWFVSKLILSSKNPISLDDYNEYICFSVDLIKKEVDQFFPLSRNKGSVEYKSKDEEYGSYCIEMLEKVKDDILKIENSDFPFDKKELKWIEDSNNYYREGHAFFIDMIYLPALETYFRFIKGEKIEPKVIDNRKILQKTKQKRIELRKFPEDLKWEQITIKFLNSNEVHITTQKETHQTDYKMMGFQNDKNKNPNVQWELLKALAIKGGFLNWENNKEFKIKERNSIKKRKQLLADSLKIYFNGIKDDPFLDYKKEKGYKIKINLIPEYVDKEVEEEEISSFDQHLNG